MKYLSFFITLRWSFLPKQWIYDKISWKHPCILIILEFSGILHLVISLVKKIGEKW